MASNAMSKLFSTPLLLFLLAFGAYAYFYQAGGWNQNSRFDLVRAMVEQGTVRIDATEANTGDKARRGEHVYCDKAPGQSWLAVPLYAALRAGLDGEISHRFLATSSYAVTVWSVALPGALAVVALWWLLGTLEFSSPAQVAISLAYALGTLAWPYATLFHGHQLTAGLLIGAFAMLAAERKNNRFAPTNLAAAGTCLGLAVVVEYQAVLVVATLSLYVLWWAPRRTWIWFFLPAGLWVLPLLMYHNAAFGGPFHLPYDFSTQEHRHQGFFMGLGWPRADALWGLTFSDFRGLFFSAPWLLLAIPGALRGWRNRGQRPEWLVALVGSSLYFWLNTSLVDWQGGWTTGPRYLVPILPLLALLAAAALPPSGGRPINRGRSFLVWCGFFLLLTWSAGLMLVATSVRPEVPDYIPRPFHDTLLPAFFQERLAVSSQSFDDYMPQRGAGQRQAWNLGILLGLEGHRSLLPLGSWILLLGGLLAFRARESPRGSTRGKNLET